MGQMRSFEAGQFSINARVYHRAGVERQYTAWGLMRPEASALLKYQPAFAGRDVLDIGAGTGRTAVYLAPLARRYQAIDYSAVMVQRFERELPDLPVAVVDMRDMSRFPDDDFDFVFAPNNVFDAVGHEDRMRTLREVRRLLRPGGVLMFSSHNRDVQDAARAPRLGYSRNPITQVQYVVHWFAAVANHLRLRRLQTFAEEYAIINDEAHNSALLHYYIGPDAQRQQLATHGFELLDVFDALGNPVPSGDRAVHSRSLLYVARRLPVS
jgi:SAM-dependent methyltransferase